jgi:hypothetical protein
MGSEREEIAEALSQLDEKRSRLDKVGAEDAKQRSDWAEEQRTILDEMAARQKVIIEQTTMLKQVSVCTNRRRR